MLNQTESEQQLCPICCHYERFEYLLRVEEEQVSSIEDGETGEIVGIFDYRYFWDVTCKGCGAAWTEEITK